jgi:hypothetical protein
MRSVNSLLRVPRKMRQVALLKAFHRLLLVLFSYEATKAEHFSALRALGKEKSYEPE